MRIAVIGAGSWGTAISHLLASKGYQARLWARKDSVVESINARHVNPRYLSDSVLHGNVTASTSFAEVLLGADAVVMVTPSGIVREIAEKVRPFLPAETPVIVCSKGFEAGSGASVLEVCEEVLGNPARLAVLSGPNHAEEVICGIPAATVIASSNHDTAVFFQNLFSTETFRTYVSDDVIGVELCAASKNVMAIAVGVSYGLGYGDNTASMLLTRGLAEMSRLVVACGGSALTCMGLAGAGDLVATCMSRHSRNRRLGELIAQGGTLDDFVEQTHMVAEGALACQTLDVLAKRYDVDLPITSLVRGVVWDGIDPAKAAFALRDRPLKPEFY